MCDEGLAIAKGASEQSPGHSLACTTATFTDPGVWPQVLLDSISRAQDSDSIWSLPLVPDDARKRDLLRFTLAPELRAKLPDDVQLERDSWPVVLDANQELLPLGVPGESYGV